jgi:hypothetical protein
VLADAGSACTGAAFWFEQLHRKNNTAIKGAFFIKYVVGAKYRSKWNCKKIFAYLPF